MTIRATGIQLMEGWHLDKRVNLSHLVTTFTVTIGVIVWLLTLQERVSIVEVNQKQAADIAAMQVDGVKNEITGMKNTIMAELREVGNRQYEHIKEHNNGNG